MNGFFDIRLLNCKNYNDRDFLEAKRCGELDLLINSLSIDNEFSGRNRIFDNASGILLDLLFGLPRGPYDDVEYVTAAPLGFICMLKTDNEPYYTENWWGAAETTIHIVQDSANTSSAGKRFIIDELDKYDLWIEEDRDEIVFKNNFLYLPTQCVSDEIRSIGIFWAKQADLATGGYWGSYVARIGRIRIKDGAGIPVTIEKTIDQVMLVEYVFSIVSM
jgi:hypothetical protein